MTTGAMLKAAKEACAAPSCKGARSRLLEVGLDANDDAVRAAASAVGRLVPDNEKSEAGGFSLVLPPGNGAVRKTKAPACCVFKPADLPRPLEKSKNLKTIKNLKTPGKLAPRRTKLARAAKCPAGGIPGRNQAGRGFCR